ncbi:hypothetical protein [Methylocella sp. CPCC 101449]|jgi:4-hydroxybenzoate polyprenyltransferase|uniref:hypothetical protein n=1 Tax=Methylocella sp. CPCC 101449 TaxID=2987531 RepID=UPI00288E412A|nr:hypothetical protein [Methylocella sp. CPCC 101449]MDT2020236.1 hypothetical protein [Methylocella sp. CPCC 101449]HEV2574824.1 hypothetical protein [Beijerinckiaceae bacterium]
MADHPTENDKSTGIRLTPEQQKRRRARNLALGLTIGFFALLFYVITWAKLGAGMFDRPL